jgi:hypothetical protein
MAERDSLQHGGLVITTERRPDGVITVLIEPNAERIEVLEVPTNA